MKYKILINGLNSSMDRAEERELGRWKVGLSKLHGRTGVKETDAMKQWLRAFKIE